MMCPLNDPFWESVKQGALYAQTELKDRNVVVDFIGFDKIDNSFIETLNRYIEDGCDGFILPGFVKGIEECATKAAAKKIPIMTFNCDFVDTTKRLSYFGPNIQAEGVLAAEMLAKSLEGEGKIVIFRGSTTSSVNVARRDAAVTKLAKYSDIKIASEIDEMEDASQVYKKLKEFLYYSPDIKGILVVGEGAKGAARVIEEMNLIGKIHLFCFNYNADMASLIRKGIVHMVFRQDGFGQGHDPIIYLYNYLVANESPESTTYTRTEVVDQYSVSE
jgi:methyl-accepting chemotaxis protein/ribose transport system substrate-binding protein